ncbi:HAD-IG family 5'-nucleotidase [Thermotomaculum hydrothermale]|nr:HAD-IG family 5'-nucleotidase [Thermotomaculum hydrothermale]
MDNGTKAPIEHRIFTNRNLKLKGIKAVGFDMDYTLAKYRSPEIEKLTFKKSIEKLVYEKHYPKELLDFEYEENFAIRGLIFDIKHGNILKTNKFRYVKRVYHGFQKYSKKERKNLYTNKKLDLASDNYRAVDTLFEIPETYLFAKLIDYFDKSSAKSQSSSYKWLYDDIRWAVDLVHRDGTLKSIIKEHPEKYIIKNSMLPLALNHFKKNGRKLFIVTNSDYNYTTFVMEFLLGKNFRDFFDIIIYSSSKPDFFTKREPFKIISEGRCFEAEKGNIYLLEQKLGVYGDSILYVGDHIYGDMLKTKQTSAWRTMMIIPELCNHIKIKKMLKEDAKRLIKMFELKNRTNRRLDQTIEELNKLIKEKEDEFDNLNLQTIKEIDSKIEKLTVEQNKLNKKLTELLTKIRELEEEIDKAYNPYFGDLFKEQNELSLFGDQVLDFACTYTSDLTNILYYSPTEYFHTPVQLMPHDKEPEFLDIEISELSEN